MHDLAALIAENLHLDMARSRHVFFDQHARVAKGALRLARGALQGGFEFARRIDAAHALAAAAGDRLDEHGIADPPGLLLEKRRRLLVAVIARHDGDAGFLHQRLGRVLQAHRADRGGWRPDEDDACPRATFGEFGVFGKEAIAGMDATRAGLLGQSYDPAARQVAFARRGRPDLMRLVGEPRVQRAAIRLRIDRDRAHAEPPRRANDPAGDLAAVGDQNGFEHARSPERPCVLKAGTDGASGSRLYSRKYNYF